MTDTTAGASAAPLKDTRTLLGHPRALWMLFMTEFWERFAFYGMRWALTLYIVAQFHGGDAAGQAPASRLYGAYLALVYATAIFGGYVADRMIGYQRSILLGAVITAAGLFAITVPNEQLFILGLALVITGNGLFKPNISTMVGKLYAPDDNRRDRAFTIFYMGINAGALVAPLITGWLASQITETPMVQNYKIVFITTGIGMLISLLWFWFGRKQLEGIGRPPEGKNGAMNMIIVLVGCAVAVPVVFWLLSGVGAEHPSIRAERSLLVAGDHAAGRSVPRRGGVSRPGHRDVVAVPVQHRVLVLLRTGRQLVQLPGPGPCRTATLAAGNFRWAGSSP